MTAFSLDPTILRRYDIRGIVDDTLTEDSYRAIGRAYGSMLVRAGGRTVAVGYDGRTHSPRLEAALVDGLSDCGLKIWRCGLGPTPALYFAAKALEADGGLQVTGSHNPPDTNGVKMVFQGRSFFGDDIAELGRIAAAGDFERGGGQVVDRPMEDQYVARLLADVRPGRDLRVAWDPANGAAGPATGKLVKGLPGHHVVINAEVDGTFPNHHADPTVEANLAQLRQVVAEEDCDLGIGFDGDGDRIGVVDGAGRVLWGDQILILLAGEILARRPGETIITEVKASQIFFDEVARLGGKPEMGPTGHSLIKTRMAETGAPLAGEMSGHIFFADGYYGYDDALYAAVRLLNVVAAAEGSLADLRDALPQMVNTPEVRVDCPEERKFPAIAAVKAALEGRTDVEVIDIDGVRVRSREGWWLLRASNTQAAIIARAEAATAEDLAALKAQLARHLADVGLTPPADLD